MPEDNTEHQPTIEWSCRNCDAAVIQDERPNVCPVCDEGVMLS